MFQTFQLGFVLLFLVFSCARAPVKKDEGASASSGNAAAERGADAETKDALQRADTFDKFLRGKLPPGEVTALKDTCQKEPQKNVFCYSVSRADSLERRVRARARVPHHYEPKVIAPLAPKTDHNRITNWRELRYGNVKRLLKGVEGFSLAQLRQIAKRAGKEKRCPNGIAIAVAATLEDYLPDQIGLDEIARLYERGAACSHRSPTDRENYLTRAGLFYFLKKDYRKASSLFHRSGSIAASFSGRALYWLGRCREALGDKAGAKAAFDQLSAKYPFTFHTLVAVVAARKDPGETMFKSQPISAKRSQRVPSINPLIVQAEELHRFGFDASAAILVDWAFENAMRAEAEVRLHLAELGDDRTKVVVVGDLLTRYPSLVSKQTLELYFPKAFFPLFERDSLDLNPFLLMSVARQESTFNPNAVSPANAQGLLQIHPDTGAKLSGTKVDLLNPEENIALGARYLTELINQLNGKTFLALAAYNAGVEKLAMWQHRFPIEDPVLFIDLISYKETRTYVAAVLRNYYWYRRIFQQADKENLARVFDPQITKGSAPVAVSSSPSSTSPSSSPAASPSLPPTPAASTATPSPAPPTASPAGLPTTVAPASTVPALPALPAEPIEPLEPGVPQ